MKGLSVRVERSLLNVSPAAWDALEHGDSPFLEYGFLRALELSGSVGPGSGWDPRYVLGEIPSENGAEPALVGAVPCFLKSHSYGEYIFDFAWASGAARAGLPYYPKLVVAAPMTPATGPRILRRPDAPAEGDPGTENNICSALVAGVRNLADDCGARSIHWLFCTQEEQRLLTDLGFIPRSSFQYHWQNRRWHSFDEFLGSLTSRKRKQIRKERARAQATVDQIEFLRGADIEVDDLEKMESFYRKTTAQHGGEAYLQLGFFALLHRFAGHRLALVRARQGESMVAGALFMHMPKALFGRYWGCAQEHPLLHFELAYYQGIDQCIAEGIPRFEAGAQGEHKLLRGFAPTPTYSAHWIRDPRLAAAVDRYISEERQSVEKYLAQLRELEPYRNDG